MLSLKILSNSSNHLTNIFVITEVCDPPVTTTLAPPYTYVWSSFLDLLAIHLPTVKMPDHKRQAAVASNPLCGWLCFERRYYVGYCRNFTSCDSIPLAEKKLPKPEYADRMINPCEACEMDGRSMFPEACFRFFLCEIPEAQTDKCLVEEEED